MTATTIRDAKLVRTPLRTNHGKVTFVLYMRPTPCGGDCIYCFSVDGITKSTTANEDTLLAVECRWDSAAQLAARFHAYNLTRGTGIKCDLAIKGDSFCGHTPEYLRAYFKAAYDFLNGQESSSLQEATALQAEAPDRCVSVKVETRPDHVTAEACRLMIELGVTTVEIGVQSLDDDVLARIARGHDVRTVITTTELLRSFGFEVGYQVMVGLPGGSSDADRAMLTELLWSPEYGPDALKIYPCLMLDSKMAPQPRLARAFEEGWWHPLTTEQYIEFLDACYPSIPRWVHINQIQRILSPDEIIHGPRQRIDRKHFDGLSRCLWQRSVAKSAWDLEADFGSYRIVTTEQNPGRYCIEATMPDDTVIGYGRVSLMGCTGIIRDLRTLGEMRCVGESPVLGKGCQHRGVGSAMLSEMERTAARFGATHLNVHSAPGSIQWFRRRGFAQEGLYLLRRPIRLHPPPERAYV
jgi:elongator complex protein 3